MKTLNKIALVLVAGLVATSCSVPEEAPIVKNDFLKVVMNASNLASRVNFIDGEGFAWQNDDQNFLTMMIMGDGYYNAKAATITVKENNYAEFMLPAVDAEKSVWFLYADSFNAPGNKFEATFRPGQTQKNAGTMDRGSVILKSAPVTVEAGTPVVEPELELVGTVQRFLIYSTTGLYAGEKVESVTMEATENIAGLIGYTSNAVPHDNGGNELETPIVYWSHSQKAKVTLENPLTIAAKNADETLGTGIYLSVAPIAVKAGYKYTITTDKAIYTIVGDKDITLKNGTILSIPINLENANVTRAERVEVVWDATSERNLWLKGNKTYSLYYSVFDWWEERFDYVWTPDDANNTYSIYYPTGCYNQWQAQLCYTVEGVTLSADKKYDLQFILLSDHNINGITLQFVDGGAIIYENRTINVKGGEEFVYRAEDIKGLNANLSLRFDFAGVTDGTTIVMKDFIVQEH